MKVGLLSDSHGKSKRLRAAMAVLADRGVDAIVHCGDICDIRDVEILASAKPEAYLVRGNMDRHLEDLPAVAEHWGVHFHDEAIEVPIGEGEFLVAVHGHRERLFQALLGDPMFPYVCCGHTHETRDEREGITRISLEPRVRYSISQRVQASLFYRYQRTRPDEEVGSRIPGTTTHEGGLEVRITIAGS